MRARKTIQSKCQTCGINTYSKGIAIKECYSCGVAKWRKLEKDAGVAPHFFTDAKIGR